YGHYIGLNSDIYERQLPAINGRQKHIINPSILDLMALQAMDMWGDSLIECYTKKNISKRTMKPHASVTTPCGFFLRVLPPSRTMHRT
ncbi:hypothetical protein, partial [Paenibacillus sp. PL2-23]|uniref:hypothetical protein n=1 Tax=Paenibacillus sp. PL2-23 TaxID=2100729 RepID=UPI0030FD01DB